MTTIKEKIKEKLVKVVWTYAKKTIKDANEESTSHGLSVKKENEWRVCFHVHTHIIICSLIILNKKNYEKYLLFICDK